MTPTNPPSDSDRAGREAIDLADTLLGIYCRDDGPESDETAHFIDTHAKLCQWIRDHDTRSDGGGAVSSLEAHLDQDIAAMRAGRPCITPSPLGDGGGAGEALTLIQRVLDDEETGKGWGPDVTMLPLLKQARDILARHGRANSTPALLDDASDMQKRLDENARQGEDEATCPDDIKVLAHKVGYLFGCSMPVSMEAVDANDVFRVTRAALGYAARIIDQPNPPSLREALAARTTGGDGSIARGIEDCKAGRIGPPIDFSKDSP